MRRMAWIPVLALPAAVLLALPQVCPTCAAGWGRVSAGESSGGGSDVVESVVSPATAKPISDVSYAAARVPPGVGDTAYIDPAHITPDSVGITISFTGGAVSALIGFRIQAGPEGQPVCQPVRPPTTSPVLHWCPRQPRDTDAWVSVVDPFRQLGHVVIPAREGPPALPIRPAPRGQPEAPDLPRAIPDTLVGPLENTVRVPAGGNLQRAIESASAGTRILLEPGATYSGPFMLPDRDDDGWVSIETDLPAVPQGVRVDTLTDFATLTANRAPGTVLIGEGADGWKLSLIEITSEHPQVNAPLYIHAGSADVADRVLVDRVYVHPRTADDHVHRCVIGNASNLTIRYSVLAECHKPGEQVQGIAVWNTPGPILIHDNYINAASQGFLSGGAATHHHPSDVSILRNHFYTPAEWQGRYHNLAAIETKDIRRLLIEGNVIDGGEFAFLIKSSAQGGSCSPNCGTQHVTVRYNEILNTRNGINTARAPAEGAGDPMHDVLLEHNRFRQIGPSSRGWKRGEGRLFQVLEAPFNLQLRNTTFETAGHSFVLIGSSGRPVTPLGEGLVIDNVVVTGPLRYRSLVSGPPRFSSHYASSNLGRVYGDCARPALPVICVSSIVRSRGADLAALAAATEGVVR